MSGQSIQFKNKGDIHPELAAVGQPSDFYVSDVKRPNNDCWSGWIKSSDGSMDYWNRFARLKKRKDKAGFQALVDELFVKFPHKGW